MLYVPILKSRQFEQRVIKSTNQLFSEQMIPLIEIIKDHHRQTDFARDLATGEYLKKKFESMERRYRINPTDDDIDTLPYYSDLVSSKKAFIDFFRFSPDKYERSIDASAVALSLRLNRNEDYYIKRLIEVSNHTNLIPVLSIKADYFPRKFKVIDLINRLKVENSQIAIRLDDSAFDRFLSDIAPILRNVDFIMYDIGEQNVASKEIEINEFNITSTKSRKLILNSPRKRDIKNGSYENRTHTSLIDNSARNISTEHPNIIGFGDYCGIKDNLPSNTPTEYGAALALFYLHYNNSFMSYVNKNTADSIRGYKNIIPQILADSTYLDPHGNCPAVERVRQLSSGGSSGNWGTWNWATMVRYITQVATGLQS